MKILCPHCQQPMKPNRAPISIDLNTKLISTASGSKQQLTAAREAEILHTIIAHYPNYISTNRIYNAVYNQFESYEPQVIQTHICKLRHKLKPLGFTIHNIRNIGYKLQELMP